MQRKIYNFNTNWLFLPEDNNKAKEREYCDSLWESISLPHSNKLLPHHYFEEREYQFISWYRRHFKIGEESKGKRLILEFDGVMSAAEVYLNSKLVGSHKGGYTSFSLDITEYVDFTKENVLAVKVDSRSRKDIPPEGNRTDYMLFGGIYREVRLSVVAPQYINWSFLEMKQVSKKEAVLIPHYEVINKEKSDHDIQIITSLLDQQGKEVKKIANSFTLVSGRNVLEQNKLVIKDPVLWSIDKSYLYQVNTSIKLEEKILDDCNFKIGVRKVEFKEDGKFYLNGESLKLRGLNRHQMYPYLGNAMPKRGQRKDAEILKYELGLNFVRSSHYPADPAFLDRCDEIGLLVMEEIPGWQHIGDSEWQKLAQENVREMILRDRNHPSIFLWGVRINESEDNYELYKATNQIAHKLDSTRPTCGVRNFRDSEFLEDVFAFNDFTENLVGDIKLPNHTPYLITEYMGHMYPTKSYDSVERLIKQAVMHIKIQNKQYGLPGIAGASGWCAFDYNTCRDFGSGDRVCYHGVCDMFRLPKFAAYFYRSQLDPAIQKVLFIARYLIPSFNEDYGSELLVFSNCEEVELYAGEKLVAIAKPDIQRYPYLPHPPFTFKDCNWWQWGGSMVGSLTAVGKIGGQEVIRQQIFPFDSPEKLALTVDFPVLIADGADCTRVVVELKDKHEQTLHLAHHPVFFTLSGPGRLIGENPFSLEAGRGAVFVQSSGEAGVIKLTAEVKGIEKAEIIIRSLPLQEEIVLI